MDQEQTLVAGINRTTLEVNSRASRLAHMNAYKNTFAIFLLNKSKETPLVFLDRKRSLPKGYLLMEQVSEDFEVGEVKITVPAHESAGKGDFAGVKECEQFKFQLDNWSVTGKEDKNSGMYVWTLYPQETCILGPGEQLMIRMYDVESYIESGLLEVEKSRISMQVRYVQADPIDRVLNTCVRQPMEAVFPVEKTMHCEILDFKTDEDAAEKGGIIEIQWNITGAAHGTLRNMQTGEEDDLEKLSSTSISKQILQPTDFRLEISSKPDVQTGRDCPKESHVPSCREMQTGQNGTSCREIHIRIASPVLDTWRLNERKDRVEWNVKCIAQDQLFLKGDLKKDRKITGARGANRGSLDLKNEVGITDRLTLCGIQTARDFESTLWIPNKQDYRQLRQFRRTDTYFYGYRLLEVVWELEEGSGMALFCHDLERRHFWKITENQSSGTWEQAIPHLSDSADRARKKYMEIRLQGEGFEIIF